jgi:hypothetical protein
MLEQTKTVHTSVYGALWLAKFVIMEEHNWFFLDVVTDCWQISESDWNFMFLFSDIMTRWNRSCAPSCDLSSVWHFNGNEDSEETQETDLRNWDIVYRRSQMSSSWSIQHNYVGFLWYEQSAIYIPVNEINNILYVFKWLQTRFETMKRFIGLQLVTISKTRVRGSTHSEIPNLSRLSQLY